jgi:hypothetical protein
LTAFSQEKPDFGPEFTGFLHREGRLTPNDGMDVIGSLPF